MDEDLIKTLKKRAKGYKYSEVQKEYAVKDDGDFVLVKRKVYERYCPPDSSAMKAYLDLTDCKGVADFTDEELEAERARLLSELRGVRGAGLENFGKTKKANGEEECEEPAGDDGIFCGGRGAGLENFGKTKKANCEEECEAPAGDDGIFCGGRGAGLENFGKTKKANGEEECEEPAGDDGIFCGGREAGLENFGKTKKADRVNESDEPAIDGYACEGRADDDFDGRGDKA